MIWPFRKRAPRPLADPPPTEALGAATGDASPPWSAPALDDALALAGSAGAEAVDAIPLLAPALAYQRGDTNQLYPLKVMHELNEALDDLVRRMTPGDYIRIGQRLRAPSLGAKDARQRWALLAVEHLPDIVSGTSHDFARLAVLSSHRNGRIREKALRVLDEQHGNDALPFLLVGCLDWVMEVQQVCWEAVRSRLRPTSAPMLVSLLPLTLRLRDFRRVQCDELVAEILLFLATQPRAVLDDGLRHPLPSVRRAVFNTIAEGGKLSTEQLRQHLRDPALALQSCRYLEAHITSWPTSEQLLSVDALSASSRTVLRLASLQLAQTFRLPGLESRLRHALTDPSRSIRQHARYHLREAGVKVDHRRTYLDALPRSLGAIAGLGEVGEPGDWEALVPSLEEGTRHACEAIRAMRTLSAAESREMRLFLVQEARPKVSRVARMSVEGEIHGGDEEMIRACMESKWPHVRRQGMRLASFLPGWRAPLLIAPFVTSDTRRAASLALARWRVRPGPSQAEFKAWRQWMRAAGVSEREEEKRAEWARFCFNIQV